MDVGQGHTAGLRVSRSGGFNGQAPALGHALPASYPTPIIQQCTPLHFSRPRTHSGNQFPTPTLPPHPSHDKWGSATPLQTPASRSQHTASFVDCWIEPTHPHVAPRTPLTSTRARTSRQKSEGPNVCASQFLNLLDLTFRGFFGVFSRFFPVSNSILSAKSQKLHTQHVQRRQGPLVDQPPPRHTPSTRALVLISQAHPRAWR
jgi:hypothetical protein